MNMNNIKGKRLKDYKGFMIEKCWEVDWDDSKQVPIKGTISYMAYYLDDEFDGIFDGDKTLKGLKKKIDKWSKLK